jgi:WD40 repeat protein
MAFIIFPMLFIYLAYYQLWHQSTRVNGNVYTINKVLTSHLADIWIVKFSPDGNLLASGSVDSSFKIWDKENGKIILNIKQPAGITYLDFSPDGNYLATASYDAKVRLWKLPKGELVREFVGHTGTVWSVNFSPDGKTIASCGEDATIKLWNIENGKIEQTLKGHTRNVWDVKFQS